MPNAVEAPFNSYQRQHEPICLPNTRINLLQEIYNWADSQDQRCIFWLSGLAGAGKSTIARTIAREFHNKKRLGASFFFSRGGGDVNHAAKFFPSIASQLANQSEALKGHICKAIAEDPDIATKGLRDQWAQLILQPLSGLKANPLQRSFVIVVDALDECEGDDDIKVILQLLVELNSRDTAQLHIFIASRPETPIRLGFRAMPGTIYHDLVLHDIPRAVVNQDISVFFKVKFREMSDGFEDLATDWPGDKKIDLLVQRAEGLFIYAATVCRFIKGHQQWPPQYLLSVFLPSDGSDCHHNRKHDIPYKSPTRELDKIYTQILQHSFKNTKGSEKRKLGELFKEVIGSLTILFEPLSATALAKLLNVGLEWINLRLRHLHSLLNIPKDQEAPVRLLHPSFRDFLLDEQRCLDQTLWVDERQRHKALAECCIQLMSSKLQRDICKQQAPGSLVQGVDSSQLEQHIPPEVQYACTYWVQHLERSGAQLNDQVYQFLQVHLLHWLEALCWIGMTSEGILAISSLEAQISVSFL